MLRLRVRSKFLSIVLIVFYRQLSLGQQVVDDPNAFQDEVEAFVKSSDEFCEKHGNALATILSESDESLMLAAYWRYLNRPTTRQPSFDSHLIKYNRNKFLGMVDQRLGTSSPGWWQKSLLQEGLVFNRKIEADYRYFVNPQYHHREKSVEPRFQGELQKFGEWILAPGTNVDTQKSGQFLFHDGKKKLELKSENLLAKLGSVDRLYSVLSFTVIKSGAVVVLYDIAEPAWELIFLDRAGEIRWSCELWGSSPVFPLMSPASFEPIADFHYFQVSEHDEQIIIHAASPKAASVEVISIDTGKHRLHFSTSLKDRK